VTAVANAAYAQYFYNFHITFVSVVNQKYTVQVHDEYVMTGNTAVLKCQVSLALNPHFRMESERRNINLKTVSLHLHLPQNSLKT